MSIVNRQSFVHLPFVVGVQLSSVGIEKPHFPFSSLFLHRGSSLPRSSAGRVLKKS